MVSGGVWMMSRGCLGVFVGDYKCLVKALEILMLDKAPNNGINPLQYLPKSLQDFWRGLEGCLDGVWKCLEGISGVCS